MSAAHLAPERAFFIACVYACVHACFRTSVYACFFIAPLAGCDSDSPADPPTDTNTSAADATTAPPDTATISDTADAADTQDTADTPDTQDTADAFVDERAPCAERNPLKNVYFGDLHAHTSLSFDAYVFDVRNDPTAAYRFAQGHPVQLPPLDANGQGTQTLQLDRPLDFAALTDHSEYFAEVQSCTDPTSAAYDTSTCQQFRVGGAESIVLWGLGLTSNDPGHLRQICSPSRVDCTEVSQDVWTRIQQAAEAAYDRTDACAFTSFVAYEYSNANGISNFHRNVIFRNATVPARVTTVFDAPTPQDLWAALHADCLDTDTPCDVLAIPHNSNWSNGNLFHVEYPGATTPAEQRAQAQDRAALEPLVEIYQHKGDSECSPGLASPLGLPDELCSFEKLRKPPFDDCGDIPGTGAMAGTGCISRLDFVRNVFAEGLRQEALIGANPFQLGIIASTDTHNGTPGAVSERDYIGHWGNNEDLPERRITPGTITPGGVLFSAGGLAAVWAEENSRDALFDAMRRRETFGTSGPRMAVRFFAAPAFPQNLCDASDAIATAYAQGVPMGGTLPTSPQETPQALQFFVSALRDPGSASHPSAPLQRIQIIKGWLDADGQLHEQVFDVAGDLAATATVDTTTCQTSGPNFDSLCSVWTDPSFDPTQRAFYYARVLEVPTCRWHTLQCNAAPEPKPESCADTTQPATTQERAWTSPIWYSPPSP